MYYAPYISLQRQLDYEFCNDDFIGKATFECNFQADKQCAYKSDDSYIVGWTNESSGIT